MSMDEVLIGMYITIQQLFVYVALYSNIGLGYNNANNVFIKNNNGEGNRISRLLI